MADPLLPRLDLNDLLDAPSGEAVPSTSPAPAAYPAASGGSTAKGGVAFFGPLATEFFVHGELTSHPTWDVHGILAVLANQNGDFSNS